MSRVYRRELSWNTSSPRRRGMYPSVCVSLLRRNPRCSKTVTRRANHGDLTGIICGVLGQFPALWGNFSRSGGDVGGVAPAGARGCGWRRRISVWGAWRRRQESRRPPRPPGPPFKLLVSGAPRHREDEPREPDRPCPLSPIPPPSRT